MGGAASTLQNKANPRSTSHRPTLEDAEEATLFTGDSRIADVFCANAGGVFVHTAKHEGASDMELLDCVTKLGKEFGDVGQELSKSLADGNIDSGDLDRMTTQIYEMNQAAAA